MEVSAAQHDPSCTAAIEALTVEVRRLRRALRKIAECPNPDSVEDCHDRMWVIAKEALSD